MEAATAPDVDEPVRAAAERPPPIDESALRRIGRDVRDELRTLRAHERFPPGLADFNVRRTARMVRDPLPILLECYERYGPVFSMRILHGRNVWVLGPEANHHVLVSNARNFLWREGSFGDLIPLLGDGLLTIDGGYHRRARRIMLPAFHRERIAAAADTMVAEAEAALAGWRPGQPWGLAVSVPPTFDRSQITNRLLSPRCAKVFARHSGWKTIAEWRAMGMVPQSRAWPRDNVLATLIEPDGPGKTAYLLTGNYRVILDYNCSNFYALAVGLLSDAVEQ